MQRSHTGVLETPRHLPAPFLPPPMYIEPNSQRFLIFFLHPSVFKNSISIFRCLTVPLYLTYPERPLRIKVLRPSPKVQVKALRNIHANKDHELEFLTNENDDLAQQLMDSKAEYAALQSWIAQLETMVADLVEKGDEQFVCLHRAMSTTWRLTQEKNEERGWCGRTIEALCWELEEEYVWGVMQVAETDEGYA